MNTLALSSLLFGLVVTICGMIVTFKNPHGKANRSVARYQFNMALWAYFYFAWQMTTEALYALFFIRVLMTFAIFIPVLHLHHVLDLFNLQTTYRKNLLKVFYLGSIALAVANLTPLFITGVEPRMLFPYWPIPGVLFNIHIIAFIPPVLFAMYLTWEIRKNETSPLQRNKLLMLIIATLAGYTFGGINWPLWTNSHLPSALNSLIIVYPLLLTSFFFKLDLFEFTIFLRGVLVHVLTALIAGSVFLLLVMPFSRDPQMITFCLIAALVIPLLTKPLVPRIRDFFSRTIFKRSEQYLRTVDISMERIRELTYTYDDLARNIVRSMLNTFPIEMAAVYLFDISRKALQLRAQEGMHNPLAQDLRYNRSSLAISQSDPLIQHINGKKNVVLRDTLMEKTNPNSTDQGVVESMTRIEADVCAPFLFAGNVQGILILSRKKNNQKFNKNDMDALFAFARMGEDIMRYIMGMETELHHTSLYSHDMNNDTKSLLQTLQFIQSPLAKNQPQERINKLIQQAEDVATRLNQTFQMNRDRSSLIMSSIRGEYEKIPVDATKLIKLSSEKFSLQADKQNVALESEVEDNPAFLAGNADDLIRVIDNLIANAFRYVEPGGHIRVYGKKLNSSFKIAVSNDGHGIDSKDIERIWEMGWQVKNAKQGASGFGLSIARQIVHLHGGTIEATSEGTGKGTQFTILLPLLEGKQSGDPLMKPKMLIVEDNELTSTLLFTIFDSLDFEVKEIAHGDLVLPYLEKNQVDVMILDLELPGMTGDQIFAAMKRNPEYSKIPIVPFTAHNDTKSPDSYASSLIWTEYRKTGRIPHIVYKFEESADRKNITKEIIDEVARNLMALGIPITKAMAEYYLQTRGIKVEDIIKEI